MIESLLVGLYTAEKMRATDKAAIEGIGIPGGHLMERAGTMVAREIRLRYAPERVVVYAGKGNNGGDGFVVARELFNAGVDVVVQAVNGRAAYTGEAKLNLDIAERLGIEVRDGVAPAGDADLVVDAVFGTGFAGVAEGPAAAAIAEMNEAFADVVALDIASGVDASTGEVQGPAVLADLTVTLHAAKVGQFVMPGAEHAGEVVIVPIGIPPSCDEEPDVWLLTAAGLQPLLQPKTARSHKRSVGRVLVIGGSRGMTGAAAMAAMGALRSGAGLTHCALPVDLAAEKPFIEVINVPVPGEGRLGRAAKPALKAEIDGMAHAVALGPGMGRDPETIALVRELVAEADVPLLIDADGLYALGDELALLRDRRAPTVLTPHEGELARLLGVSAQEVSARRLAQAREAAARSGATVLLKGWHSIVADPSGRAYVIPTGNPGLASPGTGDVLSGVIVGQLAKGLSATEAACVGGYLHGMAADLAARAGAGTEGMVASDLLQALPTAVEALKEGEDDETASEDEHEHEHMHDHDE
jgi:NAD(P)H-hydrate epimerase